VPRTPLMQTLQRISRSTPTLTRRRFLTTASSAALLPATGLAATIKIAIVGAGLAGLTAYQLKKAGHTPRIYEASSRLGGRCYSARDIFADGQVAEHGGEFFDTGHEEIIALAKELGLTLDDVLAATPKDTHPIYISAGKPYTLAQATKDWQPLYPTLQAQAKAIGTPNWRHATPAAKKLDAMTITDWINAYVPGAAAGQLGELIATAFAEENAADSEEQSALNVIGTLAEDPRDHFNLYYTDSDQRFHTRGGNDQIPTRLGENLAANIQTGTKLTAIRRLPNGKVRLTFDGAPEETFDRVIIAIPFAVIREAVDIDHADHQPSLDPARLHRRNPAAVQIFPDHLGGDARPARHHRHHQLLLRRQPRPRRQRARQSGSRCSLPPRYRGGDPRHQRAVEWADDERPVAQEPAFARQLHILPAGLSDNAAGHRVGAGGQLLLRRRAHRPRAGIHECGRGYGPAGGAATRGRYAAMRFWSAQLSWIPSRYRLCSSSDHSWHYVLV
jgi:hypothetical protein